MASAVRRVSWHCVTPQETATTSVATCPSLQAHGLFDGDLVEGVHRHLDVGEIDTRAVALTRTLTL
jgi:hypothetical protein